MNLAGAFETNGGRVLTVVGRGPDLGSARAVAERAAEAVVFEGSMRRHDIAKTIPEPVQLTTRLAAGEALAR